MSPRDCSRIAPRGLRSCVSSRSSRVGSALELCEKAITLDRLNPGRYYLLATIQQEMSLLDEAASSLRRALYVDQNFTLAHFALGNLARRQGKAQESLKHFENALSILETLHCRLKPPKPLEH